MFKKIFLKKEKNINNKNILIAALLIHAAKIDDNYTNAEKELIRLADYRSIVMIKPSLDFIDMMAVNSSTSESISFILNKVAARYGLNHWLSCLVLHT